MPAEKKTSPTDCFEDKMFRITRDIQEDSIPIALIEGDSPASGKILSLTTDGESNLDEDLEHVCLQLLAELPQVKSLSAAERKQLVRSFQDQTPPKGVHLSRIYSDVMDVAKERFGKEYVEDYGNLVPLPHPTEDQNQRLFVAGASGSGKSTWINKWCRLFVRLYPDTYIYVFSSLEEDKNLDYKLEKYINRIKIDEEWTNDKELQDMKALAHPKGGYTIAIFDDIDSIKDKKLVKEIHSYADKVMEIARHEKIQIIFVSHIMQNWGATRKIIAEATDVVCFPRGGNSAAISKFIKAYLSLDKTMEKRILDVPSRWVEISKTYPMYVLYEKGAFLIE